uniref:Uncharacterized protein n=1 Tax=Rousettus aegyptiacus TaxID=9407 RepID=A0A7J8HSS3_ROUAE|nr:hypothetical protein HJG63_011124 [Rousettus aegyptiacus]
MTTAHLCFRRSPAFSRTARSWLYTRPSSPASLSVAGIEVSPRLFTARWLASVWCWTTFHCLDGPWLPRPLATEGRLGRFQVLTMMSVAAGNSVCRFLCGHSVSLLRMTKRGSSPSARPSLHRSCCWTRLEPRRLEPHQLTLNFRRDELDSANV